MWLMFSLVGEENLLMFVFLIYSNAKQNFLKFKLVKYIKMVRKTSDNIIKNFSLYFSMKISGWNLSN